MEKMSFRGIQSRSAFAEGRKKTRRVEFNELDSGIKVSEGLLGLHLGPWDFGEGPGCGR